MNEEVCFIRRNVVVLRNYIIIIIINVENCSGYLAVYRGIFELLFEFSWS